MIAAIGTLDQTAQGWTAAELAEHSGYSEVHARALLKRLVRSGRVECVGKSPRPKISGGLYPVPVYRLSSRKHGKG